MTNRVAITADDFGAHAEVNAAIEDAHQNGVLTTASLMVGAPATDQALAMAQRNPNLGVGLHLVLTDGQSCLPPSEIPGLVDKHGRFDNNMARAGARFAFDPFARRQLAAEIRAQFEAFAATGLTLDHVNTHKHFHVHPTIFRLIVEIGRDYGLHALRWPFEPAASSRAIGARVPLSEAVLMQPWLARMRRRIERAGLVHNDAVLGLATTGHTTTDVLTRLLGETGPGRTEIYLHPARINDWPGSPPDADHRGEYEALIAPGTRDALAAAGATPVTFGGL
ncbi:hopanoid biosynthesis-associated protein HpnK [Salinisphaera sp. USBA-960]|uniref:hopanoid biosynthesis-associated protein HpnK n=1 Tax=Salinisphaera orenii TaxID=856731 RepID=UPI000DBE2D00|nr:hopanoid biosynthesis-associated protein HpnK [Salifodinibacter halophilus]NNC26626.1 hopanoid biosynthesis-associated protein HpnK [Salifodinibacter halophilus]